MRLLSFQAASTSVMGHPKGQARNQAIEIGGAAGGRISNADTEGSDFLWVTPADTTLPCSTREVSQSFFSLLQNNVLDRQTWATREDLRIAMVTWIERTYHRRRRQARLGRLTPIELETIMTTPATQAA